jgi:hypothetical protein
MNVKRQVDETWLRCVTWSGCESCVMLWRSVWLRKAFGLHRVGVTPQTPRIGKSPWQFARGCVWAEKKSLRRPYEIQGLWLRHWHGKATYRNYPVHKLACAQVWEESDITAQWASCDLPLSCSDSSLKSDIYTPRHLPFTHDIYHSPHKTCLSQLTPIINQVFHAYSSSIHCFLPHHATWSASHHLPCCSAVAQWNKSSKTASRPEL